MVAIAKEDITMTALLSFNVTSPKSEEDVTDTSHVLCHKVSSEPILAISEPTSCVSRKHHRRAFDATPDGQATANANNTLKNSP